MNCLREDKRSIEPLLFADNLLDKGSAAIDDIEQMREALRTLYARMADLREMEGPVFLLPGRVQRYHEILEEAYAAYGQVETTIEALGQEREAHHARLDQGVRQYGEE